MATSKKESHSGVIVEIFKLAGTLVGKTVLTVKRIFDSAKPAKKVAAETKKKTTAKTADKPTVAKETTSSSSKSNTSKDTDTKPAVKIKTAPKETVSEAKKESTSTPKKTVHVKAENVADQTNVSGFFGGNVTYEAKPGNNDIAGSDNSSVYLL